MLGLFEKAFVKHFFPDSGDYTQLDSLTLLESLRALQGPRLAPEMLLHDQVSADQVWSELCKACESDTSPLLLGSTGIQRTMAEKNTGRVIQVENCMEFALKGHRGKEKVVVLRDFKSAGMSSQGRF